MEIAPFTLQENPLDLKEADADQCMKAAKDNGLEIAGLHWLMAKTEGLHLTHSDDDMRCAACEYLKTDIDHGLYGGTIMVLGSPQQRNLEHGTLYENAFPGPDIIIEVSELAGEHGITSP